MMKKTDSKQAIARTMVKVAWEGKATIKTKASEPEDPNKRAIGIKHLRFELTIPGSGQVRNRVFTWGAFGSTNEAWESFLTGKLRPVLLDCFIQAQVARGIDAVAATRAGGEIAADKVSPSTITDPAAHALACALSPRGNWVPCDGEAHSNPFIDNCGCCMPNWGWIAVPPGIHSLDQYRARRARENDSVTWK